MDVQTTRRAAVAVFIIFAVNGFVFASWAARIPTVTRVLDLSPGQMGLLLLSIAAGSVIALPLAGTVAGRVGTASAVRIGGTIVAVGGLIVALALSLAVVPLTAAGLFLLGIGIGLWDVSQNIEGADIERHLGHTLMPRLHGGFSGGAFIGAVAGAGLSAANVNMPIHLLVIVVIVVVSIILFPRYFLPRGAEQNVEGTPAQAAPVSKGKSAWTERRTLLVGLVVLGAALTEGSANDWIAKATVDGLHTSDSVGAIMFAVFVASMTAVRFFGGGFIDRFGRVPVLYGSLGAGLIGLVIFVLAPNVWLAGVGAVFWGAGAALGFPMGMSAAADDPQRAAARVSVVSTIGYIAFLAGPPLLGFLGDHFTVRWALLAIGIAIIASILTAPAAKPLPGSTGATNGH